MTPRPWLHRNDEEQAETPAHAPAPAEKKFASERERELHGLAVLSLILHSVASIQEMMMALLEHVPAVTGAVLAYPLLLDRKRQALRASALEGCTDDRLDAAMDAFQEDLTALEFPLMQNQQLYKVLEEGEVVVKDDMGLLMDGILAPEQRRDGEQNLGVRKLALVPMVVENEPLGMMTFIFDRDEVDVETLELLVGHLTLALRDLLMRDEAVRFSDVDPVTWVYNRRYLVQSLEHEMARAARYGRSLSLVSLDIDGFGRFNEMYGQSLGDRLLRTVGTTLAETVSPPEIVARMKNDDFAVLLPETNRSAAVTATTRLLASFSQATVFSGDDEDAEPITASVAIVCFPEDGSTPRQLLQRATDDLQAAKADQASQRTSPGGRAASA